MTKAQNYLEDLFIRYPVLCECRAEIENAYQMLMECYHAGGKVLVCGNGGSAADADHIVGELMKGFLLPRKLGDPCFEDHLQKAFPAISLVSQCALLTAVSNDNGAELVFAQQVLGYGKSTDVVWGLSTSGNARNVVLAVETAKAIGVKSLAFTGHHGGMLKRIADVCICVPENETYKIQELHLPIYHCLCAMVEDSIWGDK